MLRAVFTRIYCMELPALLVLLAVFTGLVYWFWTRWSHRWFWKPGVLGLLAAWTAALVFQTLLLRSPNSAAAPVWQPFQSYAEALRTGGQPELLRSNFMNIVLFYPAGLLAVSALPRHWHAAVKTALVPAVFAALSGAVELAQLHWGLGLAQTDDIIHNTLGAVLGSVIFLYIPGAIRYVRSRRAEIL